MHDDGTIQLPLRKILVSTIRVLGNRILGVVAQDTAYSYSNLRLFCRYLIVIVLRLVFGYLLLDLESWKKTSHDVWLAAPD